METRHDAPRGIVPPDALRELRQFLSRSNKPLPLADAMRTAINEWIARQPDVDQPHCGYQWKQLFLPSGTQLRLHHRGRNYYAHVEGDQIIFKQRCVSPRGMVLSIAGEGRNAWRDLWLHLPQEGNWINAARLRTLQAVQRQSQPENPVAALSAAAQAMNQALKAAVTLIEHVDYQSTTVLERRLPKKRRSIDLLEDID